MAYRKENAVMQRLAPILLKFVNRRFGGMLATKEKGAAYDVASDIDVGADRLIARTIKKNFPLDVVRTEESSPTAALGNGRSWVVDPICGSTNVARGIQLFCSNIALVQHNCVVAAWVLDYSRQRLLWSVGAGVFDGRRRIPRIGRDTRHTLIDIDWGYFWRLPKKIQKAYSALDGDARVSAGFEALELCSSLGFVYVATGQLQGAVCIDVNSWDVAAAAFLIERSGGVVTNFDGSAWSLESRSLVMAGSRAVHNTLLKLIQKNGLQNVK